MNSSLNGFLNMSETKSLYHWNTSTNASSEVTVGNASAKFIIDSFILFIVVLSLLSMGCAIDKTQLYHHLRRPVGILIGMFSQFVLMPLSAFVLSKMIYVKTLHGGGILIIACSTGGVLSNLYTYFCDGDISLSVSMTTLSTIMAMGMMPLNLWIYGRNYETENFVIPYSRLAMSLLMVTSPVAVGGLLQWKTPRIAFYMVKVGSWVSFAFIFIVQTLQYSLFPDMLVAAPKNVYIFLLIFHFLGTTIGYVVAFLFQQTKRVRIAIAIESGVQNVPVALAVISLSFPQEVQQDIVLIPWLYSAIMTGTGILLCSSYKIYKKCEQEKSQSPANEKSADQQTNPGSELSNEAC